MAIADKYEKPEWAVYQVRRASGLVEDTCKHGVGHPNAEWMKKHAPEGHRGWGIHGCDGCCKKEKTNDSA